MGKVLIREKCLFGENAYLKSALPQISTFLLAQKGCDYYRKSAYYEWAQFI